MSNTFFRFKQFTVSQDHSAMKVSTDACIQGAWTPVLPEVQRVLDIGCGTGLLSLMLAQQAPQISIDAVELDAEAAKQAGDNIQASPFVDRILAHHADIRDWHAPAYDLIVCNPPFFNDSLLGDQQQRNHARHTLTFAQQDMFAAFDRLLQPAGYASVLLPLAEHERWEQLLAQRSWSVHHRLLIHPFAHSKPNRVVSLSGRRIVKEGIAENLVIYQEPKVYTAAFKALMQAYYLNL